MRIFYDKETWGGKVNFVDDNNVLVGFDMGQSCCEHFGWYIIDEMSGDTEKWEDINPSNDVLNEELKDWYFDVDFFDQLGETVVFKLKSDIKGSEDKYLHLFNHHNGYYSHGFSMSKDDKVIRKDCL